MSGPVGSSQWMYASGSGFFSYSIDQSLRFNDDDSAKLYFDPTSDGNKQIWTFSAWVKRGNLGLNYATIFSGTNVHGHQTDVRFDSADQLRVVTAGASLTMDFKTNRVFRDTGSWYHIVVAVDTTDATLLNRVKIYVNGVQETSLATTTCTQSTNCILNTASNQTTNVGALGYTTTVSKEFDGYMAEVHFVDGTQYAASNFGETKDGVWIPKEYTASHGTNGFYLPFDDSSAIGDDESANTNDFTAINLDASDVVLDSPTNNFPTMNFLDNLNWLSQGLTNESFAQGNLQASGSSWMTRSTFRLDSGKWYWEVRKPTNYAIIGIYETDGASNNSNHAYYYYNGGVNDATSNRSSPTNVYSGTNHADGTIIGVEFDADNLTLEFYANGSSIYKITSVDAGKYTASFGTAANTTFQVNFGQDPTFCGQFTGGDVGTQTDGNGNGLFKYAPSSGFLAICTSNLPDPTIGPGQDDQADDYFSTVLYTGTGSSQSITGVGFQPDFVWIKGRAARRHMLFDVIRGVTQRLISDDTNVEAVSSDTLTSFDSDGFTEGGNLNTGNNTELYVSWNWKAGGTGVSNGNGSIASTVSASTEAGFSIVTWTGNGTDGATVGHGLTSPELSFVKNRDAATNWDVCWTGFSSRSVTSLNLDATTDEFSPTQGYQTLGASTITLNNGGSGVTRVNTNTQDYVAYVFKSVPGYSDIGYYIGNGNSNGTFVYTGFSVKWLIVKTLDTSNRWILFDVARSPINPIEEKHELNPDDNSGEGTSGTDCFDFLSNGFKLRRTGNVFNTSGHDYLYFAIAEAPFKFANAR
tara:strand:+ start:6060 stop:8483 length:2424 start_codon:yes stop_codon:yes gene_type:complete